MNPIIVQVNVHHPVDDYIGKYDVTEEETVDVLDYVCEYLSNFSDDEIEEDTDLSREEYEDELLDGMPMIAEFRQKAFKDALADWADNHDMSLEEMVRGYVDNGFGSFQMVHGYGYDWMSADVYGGSADGKAKDDFNSWAEEELGVRFVFE